MKISSRRGFSVIEIVIALAILAILTGTVLASLSSYRKSQALRNTTEGAAALLAKARSMTLASQNSSAYGVRFDTASSTLTLFKGLTYISDPSSYFILSAESGVSFTFAPSSSSTGNDIIFARLTGEASNPGTFTFSVSGLAPKYVDIFNTGIIQSR